MPLSTCVQLGPYEIRAAIGKGGMGEVYQAPDTRLNRDVALKVLPGELTDSPQARDRFLCEARRRGAGAPEYLHALSSVSGRTPIRNSRC